MRSLSIDASAAFAAGQARASQSLLAELAVLAVLKATFRREFRQLSSLASLLVRLPFSWPEPSGSTAGRALGRRALPDVHLPDAVCA
jgi:hypothetical protein